MPCERYGEHCSLFFARPKITWKKPGHAAERFANHGGRGREPVVPLGLCSGTAESAPGDQLPHRGSTLSNGRCLVPASHFFEFTGTKSPKSKWRFTKTGEDWFCFAGLWRPATDDTSEAFTLLTTAPGPDVAPIHDRQMVVLERADWAAWLDLLRPEAELLKPLPAGSLWVEQVR